jgi:O-antigen/teichoic acid export membrane protein
MTPRTYRVLLLTSLVLGIVGAVFDAVFPSALPTNFAQAQEAHEDSLSASVIVLAAVGGLIGLVIGVASAVGLYLFRPWAPRLALAITVLAFPLVVLLGATALSGWSMAIAELSSTLWGAVLALTYFSPLRERFVRTDR